MITSDIKSKYLPTIGIECHVQLNTKSKLFAAVGNDAREAPPNTLISHICIGMPGALPVLNEKVIEHAIRVALAFHTEPQSSSYFERKHYFYPDLPKGYQITQLSHPIIIGGEVEITVGNDRKKIALNRVQIEEDAGKNTHPVGASYSLVDLNRAGTPLLEIVSEPVIHSATEAKAYAKEVYLLMRYAEVSDANLYYGNMRFDVNISVSTNKDQLGTRAEVKNLNSFKSVEKAVEYEIDRQIERLEKGEPITQETRGWDDAKQKTFSQRSKEEAHDYRYFPEPDIPAITISASMVDEIRDHMPVMPDELRARLKKLGLHRSTVETLVENIPAGRCVLEVLETAPDATAKRIASWLAGELQALVSAQKTTWETMHLEVEGLKQISSMIDEGIVSTSGAKRIVEVLAIEGGSPENLAKSMNLIQVSDVDTLSIIVQEVISVNEKAASDVRAGEEKALGYLVGQVMKATHGKANPGVVQQELKKRLQ